MPRKQYNSIAIQRVSFVAIDIEYHTKRFCGPYASTLAMYVHAYSNNLIFNLSTMSRVRRKVIEDLAIIWSTAVKSLLTKYHDLFSRRVCSDEQHFYRATSTMKLSRESFTGVYSIARRRTNGMIFNLLRERLQNDPFQFPPAPFSSFSPRSLLS